MPDAEAAKLLQRLRAAELPVRIQKPGAQHGGSGIFPQLTWSHACRRGGSVRDRLTEPGSGETSRPFRSTSAAPASTLFQTKSSAAVRVHACGESAHACTILPGWPARSRDVALRIPAPVTNQIKYNNVIQYVYWQQEKNTNQNEFNLYLLKYWLTTKIFRLFNLKLCHKNEVEDKPQNLWYKKNSLFSLNISLIMVLIINLNMCTIESTAKMIKKRH